MAESQHFGEINVHGGQAFFGGKNKATQYNYHYGDQRDDIATLLNRLRACAPDPAAVEPQIVVIERALEQPSADSRGRVERALDQLAHNVGNVRTATEALAAIGAIVAAHWPF